jgi:hypothetical protein
MNRRTNPRDQIGLGLGLITFIFLWGWLDASGANVNLSSGTTCLFCFVVSAVVGFAAHRLIRAIENRIP